MNEWDPVAPDDDERPTNDSRNPRWIAGPNNGRRSRGEEFIHIYVNLNVVVNNCRLIDAPNVLKTRQVMSREVFLILFVY